MVSKVVGRLEVKRGELEPLLSFESLLEDGPELKESPAGATPSSLDPSDGVAVAGVVLSPEVPLAEALASSASESDPVSVASPEESRDVESIESSVPVALSPPPTSPVLPPGVSVGPEFDPFSSVEDAPDA